MFEKNLKFGCSFVIIFFVGMLCLATCFGFFAASSDDDTPEVVMMKKAKTLNIKTFKIDKVLDNGNAIAHVDSFDGDIDYAGEVMFLNDSTEAYVDDQIITTKNGQVKQIGTCKYMSSTIPVIKIIK